MNRIIPFCLISALLLSAAMADGWISDHNWLRLFQYMLKILGVMTLVAGNTDAGTQERLAPYRQQIDSLDQRIVELFQQRARVVEEVGKIKRQAQLPVTVPTREQQVIEKAQELARGGPLPPEAVGRIYKKLVEEMRNWETKLDAAAPQFPNQPAATGGSK